jgi:hypothetical protein
VVVIGRAWRFFTHPASKAGAVIAALVFAYFVIIGLVELLAFLTLQGAAIDGRTIALRRHLSLFNIVNPVSPAFIILAFAVMVELALRIARHGTATLRSGRHGQPSGMTGRMQFMAPPSGVIIAAGLVVLAVFALDYAAPFVIPESLDISVGWGPAFEVSRVFSAVDKGILLIVLGVIIGYLARISARLQALAGGTAAER